MQVVDCARARACWSAGSSIEARIAMIAITTRSSIRVKCLFIRNLLIIWMFPEVELSEAGGC